MTTAAATPLSQAVDRPKSREKSVGWRKIREGAIFGLLMACGAFTVAITATILYILISETLHFFDPGLTDAQGNVVDIDFADFFFSLQWNPLLGAERHFGIWPLITGTLQITAVAMCVAIPVGLVTAIWLSEYASMKVRNVVKPILEVLAGIPTVVFGVFAVTMVTPLLQLDFAALWTGSPDPESWNPLRIGAYNVLAAGLTVGIMCIPIVSSLSEDALRAVPRALREGAYGLGSTRFETSIKVVLPAGLSGIIAAILLAIARAVGETMIVALAAGSVAPPMHTVFQPSIPVEVQQAGQISNAPDAPGLAQIGLMRNGATKDETGSIQLNDGSYEIDAISLDGKAAKMDRVSVWLAEAVPAKSVRLTVLDGEGKILAETVNGYSLEADTGIKKAHDKMTPTSTPDTLELRHLASKQGPFTLRVEATSAAGEAAQIKAIDASGLAFRQLSDRLLTPFNVTKPTQPMTGYMVQIFLGDVAQNTVEYQSVYAVGFTLFVMTMLITLIGGVIRRRFRQAYE